MTKKKKSLKKGLTIILIVVLALTAGYFLGDRKPFVGKKTEGREIESTIREASDLTAAYMEYNGFIKVSDGEIPFLTKKAFTMVYCARIEAGTDLKGAKVESDKEKITVVIPKSDIRSIKVDPNSIEFYDEKLAIFNWTEKDDIPEAIKEAEKNAGKNADLEQLKAVSDKRTIEIIKGIAKDISPEKNVEVKIENK